MSKNKIYIMLHLENRKKLNSEISLIDDQIFYLIEKVKKLQRPSNVVLSFKDYKKGIFPQLDTHLNAILELATDRDEKIAELFEDGQNHYPENIVKSYFENSNNSKEVIITKEDIINKLKNEEAPTFLEKTIYFITHIFSKK